MYDSYNKYIYGSRLSLQCFFLFFAYDCMAKVTAEETETCFMSDRGSPCFILIVLTI